MSGNLLSDTQFRALMIKHIFECLDLILTKDEPFSVLVNLEFTDFEPKLPEKIAPKNKIVLFTLEGYTLQSAILTAKSISFEAGFGEEDFASVVKIPLGAILQIINNDQIILVNFSEFTPTNPQDEAERSKKIFMSNPRNKGIFSK